MQTPEFKSRGAAPGAPDPRGEVKSALIGFLGEFTAFQAEIKSKLKEQETHLAMLDRQSISLNRPPLARGADLDVTVWYPAQIFFRSGQSVAAMLPARYPGSETSEDAGERLGKLTSWREEGSVELGSGQRLWSLSTGDDVGLLSVRTLTFA